MIKPQGHPAFESLAKQGSYGILRVAAALLLGLLILGSLIVAGGDQRHSLGEKQ